MTFKKAIKATGKVVLYELLPSYAAMFNGVPFWFSYADDPVLPLDSFEVNSCSWVVRNRFHERVSVDYGRRVRRERRSGGDTENTSPAVLFRTREYARPYSQRTRRGSGVPLFQDLDLVTFDEFKSLAKSYICDIAARGSET